MKWIKKNQSEIITAYDLSLNENGFRNMTCGPCVQVVVASVGVDTLCS